MLSPTESCYFVSGVSLFCPTCSFFVQWSFFFMNEIISQKMGDDGEIERKEREEETGEGKVNRERTGV